jgi:hypothetical protein
VAVALAHGATNVAAATAVLAQAQIVCGPAASSATVWRVFAELDESALVRVAAARAVQRRKVWAALSARPEGFPWLEVAGLMNSRTFVAGRPGYPWGVRKVPS